MVRDHVEPRIQWVSAAASTSSASSSPNGASFLERNEFLVRRLHSLSGLIPVGAFMCVHLTVNASVLNGPQTFQENVYGIHALGKILPIVEWAFIFAPLIFHAVIGVWIIRSGLPNTSSYSTSANIRYTLQRASGVVAMLFILYHVFHMHGWFHFQWWLDLVEPLGAHQFRPYDASSTAGMALQSPLILGFYAVGIVASVFHLANGIWTMGITWGVWTSEKAQRNALAVCGAFGVGLLFIGLSALGGMWAVGHGESLHQAQQIEKKMFDAKVEQGLVSPNSHKKAHVSGEHSTDEHSEEPEADALADAE